MPSENTVLIIDTNIVYDLNWIYCRRKIIKFKEFLLIPFKIIYLHLKFIWYKYCIWFNEVFTK